MNKEEVQQILSNAGELLELAGEFAKTPFVKIEDGILYEEKLHAYHPEYRNIEINLEKFIEFVENKNN